MAGLSTADAVRLAGITRESILEGRRRGLFHGGEKNASGDWTYSAPDVVGLALSRLFFADYRVSVGVAFELGASLADAVTNAISYPDARFRPRLAWAWRSSADPAGRLRSAWTHAPDRFETILSQQKDASAVIIVDVDRMISRLSPGLVAAVKSNAA